MRVLVVAEHDGSALRAASLSCFTFAQAVAEATGGDVTWLVLGDQIEQWSAEAARFAPVSGGRFAATCATAGRLVRRAIAAVVDERKFDLVCAAASTFSKDVLPRAAALLGGAMASDVVRHELLGRRVAIRLSRNLPGR